MLKAANITKYYRKNKGIENFNMEVSSGKAIGIIGINGSGKTTFFKVLTGLLNKDSGTITYNDKCISEYDNSLTGYLPEERSLYKDLTVIQHLLFLGRLKNMQDSDIIHKLDTYLKVLNIPQYKYATISRLSKGNQQKVQIICALIHDPKILVLDEPLSGLDIVNVNILKKLIDQLKRENKIILLASHQFEHIEHFCEELIILKNGDTMFNGTISELKSKSTLRYLRVPKDIGDKYMSTIQYQNIEINHAFYEFEISDENVAYNCLKEIVSKEAQSSISLSEPSIEQIVKEYKLV